MLNYYYVLSIPHKRIRSRSKVLISSIQNGLKGERLEPIAISIVKLVLELHPVEPEGVQEGREPLHNQKDNNGRN